MAGGKGRALQTHRPKEDGAGAEREDLRRDDPGNGGRPEVVHDDVACAQPEHMYSISGRAGGMATATGDAGTRSLVLACERMRRGLTSHRQRHQDGLGHVALIGFDREAASQKSRGDGRAGRTDEVELPPADRLDERERGREADQRRGRQREGLLPVRERAPADEPTTTVLVATDGSDGENGCR